MRQPLDLLGRQFGSLAVIDAHERIGKDIAWLCRCECGTVLPVRGGSLTSGNTKSCGCRKRSRPDVLVDLAGQKFARLTVLSRAESAANKAANKAARWLCRCDCGAEVVVAGQHLRSGNTKSCGCQRADSARERSTKHGMASTLSYRRWESIKQRCFNPNNPSYKNYGGRGITMWPEWADSFEAFHAAVGDAPDGMTLDRIDNDGNYEPGNLHWATPTQQVANRRDYPDFLTRSIDHLVALGYTVTPPG